MTRPMFPHTIDSTTLSAFRACPQKFFRQYVEHWKPQASSVHLVAGGAFASGVEAARKAFFCGEAEIFDWQECGVPKGSIQKCQTGDQELAQAAGLRALISHYGDFQCPSDSAKSLERMCGALEFYFDRYPLGQDGSTPITLPSGRRGIEFSFAEPLPIAHPVSGGPILFTGRSDMVAERAGGIYVYDEKTTTSLGPSWAKQWDMRSQFTGYIWACAKQGIKVNGAIVRGVSILKTKYDTMEVASYRSQHEVDRWEAQTVRDIARMIECWKSGIWDWNLDGACNDYGGCTFTQVCKSSNPEDWLPVAFQKRVWDPLLRKELSVAEYEASWGHVSEVMQEKPRIDLNQGFAEMLAHAGIGLG